MRRGQASLRFPDGRGLALLGSTIGLVGLLWLGGCRPGPNQAVGPRPSSTGISRQSYAERGPVRAIVTLEPAEADLCDTLRLTVQVASEVGVRVPQVDLRPLQKQFRIRHQRQSLPRREEDRDVIEHQLLLEPLRLGRFTLESLPISFRDRRGGSEEEQSFRTGPLEYTITTSIDAKELSLSQSHNLATTLDAPKQAAADVPWLLGSLAALAGVSLLLWRRRRLRRWRAAQEPSPEERASAELERIVRDDLAEEDVKRFYAELSGVVRRYQERRYQVCAPQQTTEEFLGTVVQMPEFSSDQAIVMRAFLATADRVKFAGVHPTTEQMERSLTQARALIGQEVEEGTV